MLESQNPPEIEVFDQTERITARLRDLVRSYPKGLALVKEFLQNADDAGAKDLRLIYDRRHHPDAFPNHPGMKVALGPALLFFNDQHFTESDFNGIQQIGEGSKGFDAARTGRFGQGFNTCYSVSDHPSLLTGSRIAWFDPHHYALEPGKNARAWKLSDAAACWPEWILTFAPAAPAYRYARSYSEETLHLPHDAAEPVYYWHPDDGAFPGTVFRLPVRSAEHAPHSEILPEAFTDEDFDAILDEIRRVGPALLIFLRSVTSLEIREIDADHKDTLRYWIHTNNAEHVEEKRKKLRDVVNGNPQQLLEYWLESTDPLPVVQFDQVFVVCDGEDIKREETWAVTTGLFRGTDNILLKTALEVCRHGDKAIPWAGTAVHRNSLATSVGQVTHKLACFLPLPLAEETLSATKPWTVWLHGWFDLNSSRREITRQADVGGTTQARYEWNRALMEHAVGPAWAMLVEQTCGLASDNDKPYALWPRIVNSQDTLDQALQKGFYQTAAAFPIIRGQDATGYRWCSLHDGVKDIPSRWHERLLLPLQTEGWTICNPWLPDFVEKGFRAADHRLPTITPTTLRDELKGDLNASDLACTLAEAPRQMLTQREWIFALAEFCAEGDWSNLWYLPLALLADNRLHTFKLCGTVYWVEDHERILLEPLPTRLLDIEFQKKLSQFKNLDYNSAGVVKLKLAGLIDSITEILALAKPLDKRRWLSAVFKYFKNCSAVEIKSNELRLKELKLVPDQRDQWHKMGLVTTPLLPMPGQKKELHEALMKLGISLLHNTKELSDAVHEFRHEHSGFIWNLAPSDVADYLNLHVEDPNTLNEAAFEDHQKILYPLLDFLASVDWLKKDDSRWQTLRKVRILPTLCGDRVSAETKDVFLSGGFVPVEGVGGKFRVLNTGSDDLWRKFFQSLGVKPLTGDRFIEDVLLPSFATATPEQRSTYWVWLRDNFQQIADGLATHQREALRHKIIDAPILPVKEGELVAPSRVYHPDAKETIELLGSGVARTPDMKWFRGPRGIWLIFFKETLRLQERPIADDFIAAIRAMIELSKAGGASSVREKSRKFAAYLNNRESEYLVGNSRIMRVLADLAWLPAISKSDCTKYAACPIRPDQLWQASQLVPLRLAHLVASKYPILDCWEFSPAVSTALGLRTKVDLTEVLGHFAKVRNLPVEQQTNNNAIYQAATAAYRFFGETQTSFEISTLSTKPSVYINGVWQRPDRCFFNSPYSTRWTISLEKSGLAKDNVSEQKGLEKMGVKPNPKPEHWLTMLQELSGKYGNGALPEKPDREEARIALRQLRSCTNEWLKQQDILPVLLEDGRLKDVRLAFIRDDPRLEKLECLTPLPLIEVGDAADIGQRIEDRSLKKALKDRLKEPPQIAEYSDLSKFSDQLQQRFHSKPFAESLQRIAYDSGAALPADSIARIQKLNLCITKSIAIESFVVVEKQELIAFAQNDAACFFDEDTHCLWLLSKSKSKSADQENIQDQTANTLCKICHPVNQDSLLLMRLLGKEPQEMLEYLNQKGLGQLPDTEQKEFEFSGAQESEGFEVPPLPEDEAYSTPTDEPVGDGQSSTKTGASSGDYSQTHTPKSESKSTGGSETGQKTRESTKEQRTSGKDSDHRESSPHPESANRAETGTTPPEPKPVTPKPRTDSNQSRMRTYVHCQSEEDYDDTDGESESETQAIGDAGEQIVAKAEHALGRIVTRMPRNHEGYDLESRTDNETRYIEVKSTKGAWGLRGVKVTYTQYESACESAKGKKDQAWWLYIVEYATDPEKAVIYRIPNPFTRITEFRFDNGWCEIAVDETVSESPQVPRTGDRYKRKNGEIVTVKEAVSAGNFWRIDIILPNGSTEKVTEEKTNWQKLNN